MYLPSHMGYTTYLQDSLLYEMMDTYIKYMIDFFQYKTFTHMCIHKNLPLHVSHCLYVRFQYSI